jgi:hypothetical protein
VNAEGEIVFDSFILLIVIIYFIDYNHTIAPAASTPAIAANV